MSKTANMSQLVKHDQVILTAFASILKSRFEMRGMATEGRERAAYKAAVGVVDEVLGECLAKVEVTAQ